MSGDVVEASVPTSARRPGPVVGAGALLALAGLGAALAVVAVDGGQPTWAVLFGAIAVVLLVVLTGYVAAAAPGRAGRLRVRHVDGALEVVGSPWPARAAVLAAAVAVAGTVLAGVALARADDADVTATGPVVVLAVFALGASWSATRYLTGRRPVDAVTLDRQGFAARSRGRVESFSWGDATGFTTGLGGLTVQVLGHRGTTVPVPAAELRSDAAVVARLLEHHRAHPRDRADLSASAVIERLRHAETREVR